MNIFVAKLSPSTDEDSLNTLFGEYGEVRSTKVIMDRDTGRSKCYGFVDMDDEGGRNAIDNLNDSEYEGSVIVVKESQPRENNDRGGYNRGGGFNRGGGGYNRGGGGGYNRDNRGGGGDRYNRGGDRRGGGDRNRGGGDRYNKRDNDGFDTSKW